MFESIRHSVSVVENFFDRIKLGYKWKYDRWDELNITTYRGYGTEEQVHIKGRVLDDKGAETDARHLSVWKSLTNTIRRVETDEIPGARVRVDFQGHGVEVETDDDGFFDLTIDLERPLEGDGPWYGASVELLKPESPDGERVAADAFVIVPFDDAEFGVISDLDDTVIVTGATSSLRMAKTVLLNSAYTRAPFPGVPAFYRALNLGPDAKGHNPMFYVSSSPWNLYDMFEAFFEERDLPLGPVFLKDFGFTREKFLKSGHGEHKRGRIRKLLRTYPDLPFILVGDSGQEDPEIYRSIVRDHADRILAVYIRDVTSPERDREVDEIADELEKRGVPMVRVETTIEAAEHAAENGFIPDFAVDDVRSDMKEEQEREETWLEKVLR